MEKSILHHRTSKLSKSISCHLPNYLPKIEQEKNFPKEPNLLLSTYPLNCVNGTSWPLWGSSIHRVCPQWVKALSAAWREAPRAPVFHVVCASLHWGHLLASPSPNRQTLPFQLQCSWLQLTTRGRKQKCPIQQERKTMFLCKARGSVFWLTNSSVTSYCWPLISPFWGIILSFSINDLNHYFLNCCV